MDERAFRRAVLSVLARIEANQAKLAAQIGAIMTDATDTAGVLARIQADVAENTSTEASAKTLLGNIAAELKAAIAAGQSAGLTTDQLAAFNAVADTLEANDADLAAAVTANTPPTTAPAAPTPTS